MCSPYVPTFQRPYVPLKRQFTYVLHDPISKKMETINNRFVQYFCYQMALSALYQCLEGYTGFHVGPYLWQFAVNLRKYLASLSV
jgi:hypothetical protein